MIYLWTLFEVLGDKYLEVINNSLKNGIFLEEWKISTVVSMEKIRNTNKAEEFRSINTLLSYEKHKHI